MGRAIRFGIVTNQNLPFGTLVERWRLFEELGFDSVWDCDMLNQSLYESRERSAPFFEGWTLLAALAAPTDRIRVGVLVSSNILRHPGLLAQQAVTVDHVSNGRLELGLGASGPARYFDQFGIRVPPPGELVIASTRRSRSSTASCATRRRPSRGYYRLDGAYVRPRPVQRPRPPLTLAAHGRRTLRICVEYADAWNSYSRVEEMRERNAILDEHCAAIRRDPAEIRRSLYCWASEMARQGLPDSW